MDDGNNFAWRQKPSRQFTASQARDQTVLSQFVRKDKAYSFMKNIRGSPPYYQRTFYDLLAMICQLGIVHPGIDVHFDIVFLNDHCGIVLHDGVFKLFVNVDR